MEELMKILGGLAETRKRLEARAAEEKRVRESLQLQPRWTGVLDTEKRTEGR